MLTIITNNVPRDIINCWELTEAEQAEFDFLDWDNLKSDNPQSSPEFFRYKGELYYIETGEGRLPDSDWYYMSDSYFSGICFRWPAQDWNPQEPDWERIIVGRYYYPED